MLRSMSRARSKLVDTTYHGLGLFGPISDSRSLRN